MFHLIFELNTWSFDLGNLFSVHTLKFRTEHEHKFMYSTLSAQQGVTITGMFFIDIDSGKTTPINYTKEG